MFHLKARIHFEEVKVLLSIHDELNRSGAGVIHSLCQRDRLFAHRLARGFIEERARRLFHNFLVAPLDRAFPLSQIDPVAVAVAKHLNFDVAGLGHEFFDENPVIPKGICRFVLGALETLTRFFVIPRDPHPFAATAGGCLDHHRIADVV